MPPDEMFRYLKAPALALSGDYHRNGPADHPAIQFARKPSLRCKQSRVQASGVDSQLVRGSRSPEACYSLS